MTIAYKPVKIIRYKNTCIHCGKALKLKVLIRTFGYIKEHCVLITDSDLINLLKRGNWKK